MNPVAAFGEVRHIGYVVPPERLQAHVAHWARTMGVGPWLLEEHVTVSEYEHLGTARGAVDITLATAQLGSLQMQLLAQHDDHPSAFLDFVERTQGEGGMHHLGFWPPDLARAEELAAEMGWEQWTSGRIDNRGRFRTYLTEDHPGTVIALAEVPETRRQYFETELADLGRRFDPTFDELFVRR
ncbi:MAG: VOC family protein [Ilumatobacteraceae bacterium]|nr:MAG: VOC family protein [Actinomycetota bacterium]